MSPHRPKRTRLRAKAKPRAPRLSDEALGAVEAAIKYTFKDKALLHRAMTHPSVIAAEDMMHHSNQRLEFLGDRVLGLVIAERLIERYPTEREGQLAPRLNAYVRKEACAEAVRHIGLGEYMIMSSSDEADGGRLRDGALGDLCEAVIAAIYKDGGLKVARTFIERAWAPQFSKPVESAKDAKTTLQEWAQQRGLALPRYEVIDRTGPDHAPEFTIKVTLENGTHAEATGTSKQDAQRSAASLLLEQIQK